jgi:hypothetical protein
MLGYYLKNVISLLKLYNYETIIEKRFYYPSVFVLRADTSGYELSNINQQANRYPYGSKHHRRPERLATDV